MSPNENDPKWTPSEWTRSEWKNREWALTFRDCMHTVYGCIRIAW